MQNKSTLCLERADQTTVGLVQQAVWQYGGATNIFSTFCSLIISSPGLTFTIFYTDDGNPSYR